MVMTKVDAVKYILNNMKESDARQLFKHSLSLTILSQLAVRLPVEENKILKRLIGDQFYAVVISAVEENKELISEFGHLNAVNETISLFEQLVSGGFIEFTFPEQEDPNEKDNSLKKTLSWLDMARSL